MTTPLIHTATSPSGISYVTTATSTTSSVEHTLVCLAGWACQASDFSTFFQTLSTNNPGIVAYSLDYPGHGSTPATQDSDVSISSYAAVTQRFIHEMQLPSVVLLGHSMGARVALQTWFQEASLSSPVEKSHERRIIGLVLVDGSHFKLMKPKSPLDGDEMSLREKTEFVNATFQSNMFGPKTPESIKRGFAAHIRGMRPEIVVLEWKGMLEYDFGDHDHHDKALEALGRDDKMKGRVLILQCTAFDEQAKRRSLKEGEVVGWMWYLKEEVPHVKFGIVEDSFHFPQVDCPEVTREKIVDFVQSLH